MTESKQSGVEVRRQVMGDAFVDRALGNATEFTQPLQDFVNEHAWGGVWNREGLPLKTRSLITLAALTEREEVAHIETRLIFEFQRNVELPPRETGA